ncbi:hypothetical protein PHMEG_00014246 [Phytophthora megakarya]|uniref:Uncharacterized protein n=1 Tax=Phytophthora megakarya TaxID=4795 RepID=A0A225W5B6_9STRA|nr:hypothetical protein PHMEG_00014246 [Phytophthora megakarya]
MQLHKHGFIKLSQMPREGPCTSTVVETHFETIPVFHDSVQDHADQIKVLISSLSQTHNKLNKHFCHLMSDLLLEEDWKSSSGQENVGSHGDFHFQTNPRFQISWVDRVTRTSNETETSR